MHKKDIGGILTSSRKNCNIYIMSSEVLKKKTAWVKFVCRSGLQIFYTSFQQKENDCCDLPVADLTITMLLRRRTYYYVMSLILPCTLIACTIFLEFILPAESGERVGLGITILLSMAVFQELTSEKLPSSSEHFPLLGKNDTLKTSVLMLALRF